MASVGPNTNQSSEPTEARKLLDIVQGKARIELGALSEKELDDFLQEILGGIDLRELRGFKPLRELLSFRSDSNGIFSGGVERILVSKEISFREEGFAETEVVDMNTQMIRLLYPMDGRLDPEIVYRRLETSEETIDDKVARSWGKQAYPYKGKESLFMLKRPRNHTGVTDNLVIVKYEYQKVPHEKVHEIVDVLVKSLPFSRLREEFGEHTARLAYHMIRNLAGANRETAEELKRQYERFQEKNVVLERLCGSISYPH